MKKYKGWISAKAYLEYLLKERKVFIDGGMGIAVLGVNEEIARVAKKLKLNYYEL